MDKDIIILKYEQEELKAAEKKTIVLKDNNELQAQKVDELQEKMKKAYKLAGRNLIEPEGTKKTYEKIKTPIKEVDNEIKSYDDLYEKAESSLIARGMNIDNLDHNSIISQKDLDEIILELNRPFSRREKWVKEDFVAVFIASSIGSLADIILGTRDNKLTGADPRRGFQSDFSKWLNQFHEHEGGAPIDYQGSGFGGPFHRGLSKGHDILRFVESIMMFKNGQFAGIRYIDGVPNKVILSVNQYGKPYEQLSTIESILRYTKHMFADLLSTCSLPFPGSSFLVESNNRELRKFAADIYQNGFNIKNVIIQSVSTIIIEVILRVYHSVHSIQKYKYEFELDDDYSNFEAIKHLFKQESKEKLNEMLLVAHTIVTAINMGKVIMNKAPWEINITEIFSVIRYSVKVISNTMKRNSEYLKLIRNADEIHRYWHQLEQEVCYDDIMINEMQDILII